MPSESASKWKSAFLCVVVLLCQGSAQDAPPDTCIAQKALTPGLGFRVRGEYHGREFEDYYFPTGSESTPGMFQSFRSCRATGHPYPVPYADPWFPLPKGCASEHSSFKPKADIDDKSLAPYCPRDSKKPALIGVLAALDNQNTKFDKLMYAVRSVNFTFLAQGTAYEPIAPLGNALGTMMGPMQHHQLFFHIDGNPTIAPPLLANETANKKWLLIHMQGDGVHGRLMTDAELPSSHTAWTWDVPTSPIEPSWVEEFLRDDEHTEYSHLAWNCQIFASQLLAFVGAECRSWKMPVCPPADLEDKLPLIIYQGKGLRLASAVSISLIAFLSALFWRMGWSCRCCLRRCPCGRRKVSEAGLDVDLLSQ